MLKTIVPAIEREAIHKIIRRHESQKPLGIAVTPEDRRILRELARPLAEIAALPVQQETKRLWARLNRLQAERPMIWLNDICWHELDVDGDLALTTSSPFCRRIEAGLRQTLYWWKRMPGDLVVDPVIYSPLAVDNSGIGLDVEEDTLASDARNDIVSHRYHPVIGGEEDVERIRIPTITHDEKKSEADFAAYRDIFDGVLAVEKRGAPSISFSPWDDIVRLMGGEEALLSLAMRPEFVHRLVERVLGAYLGALDQYESLNLLALNNTNVRIGSGAYGYTDELPGAGFEPGRVRSTNLWGNATAQIFSEVSPQMHEEFALAYERRWLARFGLAYYGCCEPLDRKMDLLRTVPNLRKISVSPWNDIGRMSEEINRDYVFSWKPNPAVLAYDNWDLEAARNDLVNTLCAARKNGCNVEIIMKDISTVRYQPHRLWEWVKMAAEVSRRIYA